MSTAVTLSPATVESLAHGLHADPFAVLSPHEIRRLGASGLAIGTVRPRVASVTVVERTTGRTMPMERIHPEGVFEAFIEGATREDFDYRYRMTWPDGNESELDDPYRYGPVLT